MSENSKIEWTDHTFNPWEGCQKVGPGCDHCYAEARNARFGGGMAINWGPGAPRRRTSVANWRKPLAWNAAHAQFFAEHGRRQRVFCASLADVFDNAVDPAWRRDLFDLIELTPNLDWLLLTKRIGNVQDMVRVARTGDWLLGRRNVWLGATIVNQEEADRDIPKLLAVPAAKRFLSMEPLLGQVDIRRWLAQCCGCPIPGHPGDGFMQPPDPPLCCEDFKPGGIDWVIAGGESGPGARPMHPDWARFLRDQCQAAGVPYLFKQWGEYHPSREHSHEEHGCTDTPEMIHVSGEREYRPLEAFKLTFTDGWAGMCKLGKKKAGRLLDGREWNQFPEVGQ
jgi:protein gp37